MTVEQQLAGARHVPRERWEQLPPRERAYVMVGDVVHYLALPPPDEMTVVHAAHYRDLLRLAAHVHNGRVVDARRLAARIERETRGTHDV